MHNKNQQAIRDKLEYIARYIDVHYKERPGDWALYLHWFIQVLVSLEETDTVG